MTISPTVAPAEIRAGRVTNDVQGDKKWNKYFTLCCRYHPTCLEIDGEDIYVVDKAGLKRVRLQCLNCQKNPQPNMPPKTDFVVICFVWFYVCVFYFGYHSHIFYANM